MLLDPALSAAGEQLTVEGDGTVIVAPAEVKLRLFALAPAPVTLDIWIEFVVALDASVAFTYATVPVARAVVFSPVNTQVAAPALEEQLMVLCAAVAAGPAVIVIPVISAVEYVTVHSRLAGAVPETVRATPTVAVAPGFATVETRFRLLVCACAIEWKPRRSRTLLNSKDERVVRILFQVRRIHFGPQR